MTGVVTERQGFSSLLALSKKKNKSTFGFMVNPNGIVVMVVQNCMNIPKYTLFGYI